MVTHTLDYTVNTLTMCRWRDRRRQARHYAQISFGLTFLCTCPYGGTRETKLASENVNGHQWHNHLLNPNMQNIISYQLLVTYLSPKRLISGTAAINRPTLLVSDKMDYLDEGHKNTAYSIKYPTASILMLFFVTGFSARTFLFTL